MDKLESFCLFFHLVNVFGLCTLNTCFLRVLLVTPSLFIYSVKKGKHSEFILKGVGFRQQTGRIIEALLNK